MSAGDDNAEADGPVGNGGGVGVPIEVDTSELPEDPGAQRLAELEVQVATAEREKKENYDKYLRSVADLENYRKRTKRDIDDAKSEAKTKVLKEILPVVDNLERALAHEGNDVNAVLEGVRLVQRQFLTALERLDVTPVDAMSASFDPNLHEAIGQEESDAAAGTVIKVLQTGYKLGDRLLRPALVVIAKPRSAEPG
jgi:molecular chaperone GrpE